MQIGIDYTSSAQPEHVQAKEIVPTWQDVSPQEISDVLLACLGVQRKRPVMLTLSNDELQALSLPPLCAEGCPLEIDFRLTLFHIGKVDTKEQVASLRLGVVFYWTDPRMAGWECPILPATLWGPELHLRNCIGGASLEYEQFAMIDSEEGRLKRIINYEAVIMAPMNLEDFPFDIQEVKPEFVSISHWRQHDLKRGGSMPLGQAYSLSPVRRPEEGLFMMQLCKDAIYEWDLHSYNADLRTSINSAGFTISVLSVTLTLRRREKYYLLKCVVPLLLLVTTAHLSKILPLDQFSTRLDLTFTMFLAAIGLLNVINQILPVVEVLTVVDKITFSSMSMLIWCGASDGLLYCFCEASWTRIADMVIGIIGCSVYLFWVVLMIVNKQRRQLAQLKHVEDSVAKGRLSARLSATVHGDTF